MTEHAHTGDTLRGLALERRECAVAIPGNGMGAWAQMPITEQI